ncbi:MAG: carboxylesterase family protein [Sphingomonadales bacterium]|nr:carboxylesterase family protein [Sphingomonadales bacterium]
MTLSRRGAIGAIGAIAALPALPRAASDAEAVTAEVTIAQGRLGGTIEQGVRVFRGIPYAQPPVAALRFRPPRPAPAWSGRRSATSFAPAPIQPPAPGGMSHRRFLGADTSEDCLYLNVWAPASPGPHPVFVWIHGGGNIAGAASQLDGAVWARSGIVCVTVGYRLGAFGFLELGGLLGPEFRGSGVNALRDQIAALRWIQDNISAFGGDPDRVTIGGVSAGGKNVVSLMASPLARGLFASAIVESGGQTWHDLAGADAVARDLMRRLAIGDCTLAALLALPAATIETAQMQTVIGWDRPYPYRAIVGSDVLPEVPSQALRASGRRYRLLIGSNRDDGLIFIPPGSEEGPVAQHILANVDVGAARSIAERYERLFPAEDALHRRVRLVTAEEYAMPSLAVADAVRRARGRVWMYRFAQEASSGPHAGWAVHASEAVFVWKAFDDPILAANFGSVDRAARRLGDEMHARWSAFIRGKAPEAADAASWPPFDGHAILTFQDNGASHGRIDAAEAALWKGVLT